MTADSPQSRPRFQFSLGEMLLAVFVAATALWLVTSRRWDTDERMILGLWVVAVSGAIARSRLRNRRGIWLAAAAGGLAPLAAYATYWLWLRGELVRATISDRHLLTNTIVAASAGALVAGLAAAAITPSGLEKWPPKERAVALRRRMLVIVGAIAALATAFGGYTAYQRSVAWKSRDAGWLSGSLVGRAISRDGTRWGGYMGAEYSGLNDHILQLADPRSSDPKPVFVEFSEPIESIAFSPDGKRLAVARYRLPPDVLILDSLTGQEQHTLRLEPQPGGFGSGPAVVFSTDGNVVLLRTILHSHAGSQTLIQAWNVSDGTPAWQREFDGACFLYATRYRLRMARFSESEHQVPSSAGHSFPVAVTIVDLETGEELRSFDPCFNHFRLRFAPEGDRFLCGRKVYDLKTGDMQELPAELVTFTQDGTRVLGVQWQPLPLSRREPICSLPILRHWLRGDSRARLVAFDAQSGRQLFATRWTEGLTSQLVLPEDCSFAVSGNRLWDIPAAAR